MIAREIGGYEAELPEFAPPRFYRRSYRLEDRDVWMWYPVGLHWIARHWAVFPRHLWILALRIGVLDGPSYARFHEMKWRWDFWNGSHSWLAFRYCRRHGWAAYCARYR